MMESELKNQDDLLQQIQNLRTENKLLEKHVFVLNECLSVNELKEKISILEKKKEKLNLLENVIERLRAEIEPLEYLKSVLENKLLNENNTNSNMLQTCIDLKPGSMNDINLNESNNSKSQNSKNISTNLSSSQKSYNDLLLANSNPVSVVNEGSIDDCMQLLDQYDVVTDLEISNFPDENHSIIQNAIEEPTMSVKDCNKVQNKHGSLHNLVITKNNCEDSEVQLCNEEKESIKENMNNVTKSAAINTTNYNNHISQDNEASTSKFQEKNCPDMYDNLIFGEMPDIPLKQEIDSVTFEDKLNYYGKDHDISIIKLLLEEHDKQHEISEEEGDFRTIERETTHFDESTAQAEQVKCIENINSFNDMNLKIDILRGIYCLGFTNPTNLQKRVVVNCLNGRDVIVLAKRGTGRTMMFTIPLLQQIKTSLNECQALVLVPTRDLAVHIQKIIMSVGDFMGVNVCIGGDNVPKKLSVIPHVIVGTPAGVCNMIACRSLYTGCIQTVVINKIDKMTNDHNIKLIEDIMKKLEKTKQVTLIASKNLDRVLDIYMDSLLDPLIIISEENDVIKSLPKEFYLTTDEDTKLKDFCKIFDKLKMQRAIIFCNTLDRAQKLLESLTMLNYSVSRFHLEMSASERELILNTFSTDDLQMIITTDPIKGCQFQSADWIINYDFPSNPICYLNRIGKCTEQTKVFNLVNENENDTKLIIESYNKSYPMIPIYELHFIK